jgi:hypothetical protein
VTKDKYGALCLIYRIIVKIYCCFWLITYGNYLIRNKYGIAVSKGTYYSTHHTILLPYVHDVRSYFHSSLRLCITNANHHILCKQMCDLDIDGVVTPLLMRDMILMLSMQELFPWIMDQIGSPT